MPNDDQTAAPAAEVDVAVVGAGQAGLAVGFYLRRTELSHLLLDEQEGPGGAWRHGWESLRLFSPAQWSSIPGWLMPRGADEYPSRDEVVAYLGEYERRYALPVTRPVRVQSVRRDDDRLRLETTAGGWRARAVVAATGSWARPFIPEVPGRERFRGVQLHSAAYRSPDTLAGMRAVVVGGGNSGAQIVAELEEAQAAGRIASVVWATVAEPTFLPDHVDGRYLFEQATARYNAIREGRTPDPPRSLGDVVAVEPVRRARAGGRLTSVRMFVRLTERGVVWPDGREEAVDAVVWCTGFRPALDFLRPLGVLHPSEESGVAHPGHVAGEPVRERVAITGAAGTRSALEPRLWLIGYGDWTGFASATLIGVGRSARATVDEVVKELRR